MKGKLVVSLLILSLTTLLLALLSPEPAETIVRFFTGPFRNIYAFGSFLSAALLLVIAGTGISICFRGGQFNLGGEGQVYSGAAASLTAALLLPLMPGFIAKPLLIAAAMITGFLIAALSGWLRHRFSIHELISSYLTSGALVFFCDFLISGPLRDEESFLIATQRIPGAYTLAQMLPPSPLHSGIFIAAAVAAAAHIFLHRSVWGYRLRMFGEQSTFARFGGISPRTYRIMPIGISGALYGLAGAVALLGIHHRGIQGFTAGLGWNGIAVALIAGTSPVMTLYAALLVAYIEIGISSAMAGAAVTYDLGLIVRGAILIVVTLKVLKRKQEELL